MDTTRLLPAGPSARVASRRRTRRRRTIVLGLLVCAGIATVFALSARGVLENEDPRFALAPQKGIVADSGIGVADGFIEENTGISPFADDVPAIAKLQPDIRAAIQEAARAAREDDIEFVVTNGWRSAAYQQSLLDDAVIRYGSLEEARRYVSTPETSKHVTGEAVDIGPTDADSWLSQHGAEFGLCQTYSNEMWHFELATAPGGECPIQKEDASVG